MVIGNRGSDGQRFLPVPHGAPIGSPADAARAVIVAEHKGQVMRFAYAFLAVALIVAGCKANSTRDLASCKLEYYRVLPANISNPAPNFAQFVDICMIAKGYKPDNSRAVACLVSPEEHCYTEPAWYEFSN